MLDRCIVRVDFRDSLNNCLMVAGRDKVDLEGMFGVEGRKPRVAGNEPIQISFSLQA
ncbi:hypothetical protein D9M69_666960 [compost metagenome]